MRELFKLSMSSIAALGISAPFILSGLGLEGTERTFASCLLYANRWL